MIISATARALTGSLTTPGAPVDWYPAKVGYRPWADMTADWTAGLTLSRVFNYVPNIIFQAVLDWPFATSITPKESATEGCYLAACMKCTAAYKTSEI